MTSRVIQLLTAPAARMRLWYLVAIFVVIAIGLASRRIPGLFPDFLGKYPGDVLWAVMVFLGWGVVFPRHSTLRIAIYAMISSICIEFLKLLESPMLDTIRNTPGGRLVFGHIFSWGNLAAYAIGIAIVAVVECAMRADRKP